MSRKIAPIAFGLIVAVAACSRNDHQRADSALATDLSLAAQARGYQPLDSLSAPERAAGVAALGGAATATAPAPVKRTSSTAAATTTRRSTSGTRRTTTTSGGNVSSAPAPSREVTVKHTKRDAAIGAAAGAILGATTSKDKVKGGVIGAAVGGILGGVIGNNVDKTKKKVP